MSAKKPTKDKIIQELSTALVTCLKCQGLSGMVMNGTKVQSIRDRVCDALEMAGHEVDRDAAYALGYNKKDYAQWLKERQTAEKGGVK